MKLKKVLSLLLAVVLVASAAAIALAESTDTTTNEAATEETETTTATTETESYTLDEMLTAAMTDAYTRQAAYAAYAEAFTDSRSLSNLDIDDEIVLLEMLLKANDVALPAADDVTVPDTVADAYTAVAEAEANTVTMLKTYLAQEDLGRDAQIIFNTVLQDSYENAISFTSKARTAQQQQEWTNIMNDDNTKVVVVQNNSPYGGGFGGYGQSTVYVYTNNSSSTDTDTDATDTTTDSTTEDSVSD